MSRDGRWRFGMDHRGEQVLVDLSNDPTGEINLCDNPDFGSVLGDLQSEYTSWHDRQRCLVEGKVGRDPVVIKERGLQRTPGYYGVTWAFAVVRPDHDAPAAVLASQDGVGDVRLTQGNVEVTLFGKKVTAALDEATGCQTVAVATQATHPGLLSPRAEGFRAVLYVNNEARSELVLDRPEIFDQHRAELRIHPAGGATRAYRIWTEFLHPHDSTERPGIARATRGLCDVDPAG